ncbi:MAG: ribonuclease HII [Methylobacter sp.]|nr:MAG: ribonuclease HII [Methylobacter sp.]
MSSFSTSILIAGVDEAGRGPLAGPVFAAAVILDPGFTIAGLRDSKKLSAAKRESLAAIIRSKALAWSIAQASVDEIDCLNILNATLLAMRRAVEGLAVKPEQVLIDGNRIPDLAVPAQAIIKGDDKIAAISAASILAKVERDKLMCEYNQQYPHFAFHEHKAYGTRKHLEEISQFGILAVHRKSFNPIKSLLEERE